MSRWRKWVQVGVVLIMSVFLSCPGFSSVAYGGNLQKSSESHVVLTKFYHTGEYLRRGSIVAHSDGRGAHPMRIATVNRNKVRINRNVGAENRNMKVMNRNMATIHSTFNKKKTSYVNDRKLSLNGRRTNVHTTSRRLFHAMHTVQSGDTLWVLALTNHTTVSHLLAMNHLQSDKIYPGEQLRVYEGTRKVWNRMQSVVYKKFGLPQDLVPIYQAAGKEFGIPWTVLAAIHHQETDYSTDGYEVSSCGAEGPMQFMPTTFERYAVAAPGHHGAPNIHNVSDAIYSCAHMLQEDGYNQNPSMALYLYNHSTAYVQSVEQFASHIPMTETERV